MKKSFESQQETYQTLSGEAKLIVDILVYACCPVNKKALEELFPDITCPGTRLHKTIQQLNGEYIIYYLSVDSTDYYTSEMVPRLAVSLLLQQIKRECDIENKINQPSFWKEINRHGKPVRDRIIASFFNIKLPELTKSIFTQSCPSLIEALSGIKTSVDLEKNFPEKYLVRHFRETIFQHVENICPDPFIDDWFKQFSNVHPNSPAFLATLRDIRAIPELLLPGRLDEIPGKVNSNTREGASLLGMYHLYRKEYDLAINYLTEGETDKNGYDYTLASEYSLFTFGRTIARLLVSPAANRTQADNLFNENDINTLTPLAQYLLHVLKKHSGLHTTGSMVFLERQASAMGWNLPLLESHFTTPAEEHESSPMKKQKNMTELPETWEKDLAPLLTLTVEPENEWQKKQVFLTAGTRVAYFIQTWGKGQWMIVPMIQTTKDGITWTSGRKIGTEKLENCSMPGMNDFDRQLANSSLSKSEMLILLAGHPHVYLDSKHQPLHINIVAEEPEIRICRDDTGYAISTNSQAFSSREEITWERNFQGATITRITSRQSGILRKMDRFTHFPFAARDHLLLLQKHLQGIITIHSDISDDNDVVKTIEGDSRIIIQINPTYDVFRAKLFTKPLHSVPPYCEVGQGATSVSGLVNGEKWLATRDLEKEKQNFKIVQSATRKYANHYETENSYLYTHPANCLLLLEFVDSNPEIAIIEWPKGTRFRLHRKMSCNDLHLSLTSSGYWFRLEGELNVDDTLFIPVQQLLDNLSRDENNYFPIGNYEFIRLTEELKKRLEALQTISTRDKNELLLPSFIAPLLHEWEEAGISLQTDKSIKDLRQQIAHPEQNPYPIPDSLNAKLRDYQSAGFQWMARLHSWGAGGCLADDMGLGKTVQSIAILLHLAPRGASLVVCPASVVPNWKEEIERFAPTLRTLVLNTEHDRQSLIKGASTHDVVLASYGMLVSEAKTLTDKSWQIAVLDEAHTIKNKQTRVSKVSMELHADFRLALTGTPMQNHPGEIWSLFQFLNPGFLGSSKQFSERFVKTIMLDKDKQQQTLLKQLLSPFLLRRTKNAVLQDLPPKTDIQKTIELSKAEMAIYESLRRKAEKKVQETPSGETIKILAEITKLRMAACNVNLVSDLTMKTSKLEILVEILEELLYSDHKVLIFSQFTSNLDLIRRELDDKHFAYLYLDGNTPIKEREKLVKSFQDGDISFFLISLKAGGLGLNLTSADFVIHMDPWWNPAIESQASDRAYRIGQVRPVTIYHLIAQNTIEEKIKHLHQTKKDMADALLKGTDISGQLTREEILELLRKN